MMTITAETSRVPGFVAELVRAANEVDRLTAVEIESLLLLAMTTVRDLREQAGIPGSGTEDDAIVRLDIVAKGRRHIFPSEYLGNPSRSGGYGPDSLDRRRQRDRCDLEAVAVKQQGSSLIEFRCDLVASPGLLSSHSALP
ncbi:hypothetical protein [Rhizobium ruizarguesonis]|uniref:hypothetical protein n=1 Tax=Rhizobium ruizarguesonis TaxID=2081791 RepID=UPI001FE21913|nr:hypothetical protein [Rhizobium ruizarguesonis]